MTGTAQRHWEARATQRALDRLADADARAGRPSSPAALVAAAQTLANDGEFTVKQVVDRAGVALQTFYRHFGSKDELVLAVLEENLLQGNRAIRELADRHDSPLDRLAAVIRAPFEVATSEADLPGLRFHARERVRLSEEFPAEVEACLSPYRDLVIEYMEAAVEAGEIAPVDIVRDAEIILHLVLTYTHNVASGALPYDPIDAAGYLWAFCEAALQRGRHDGADGAG
jgi:TetR/AcrR family transcriptional regulator